MCETGNLIHGGVLIPYKDQILGRDCRQEVSDECNSPRLLSVED